MSSRTDVETMHGYNYSKIAHFKWVFQNCYKPSRRVKADVSGPGVAQGPSDKYLKENLYSPAETDRPRS